MLYLLHGDNQLASRGELDSLRRSFAGRDLRVVDGRKATDDLVVQALESGSLFGGTHAVIFEELLSRFFRKNKDAESLVVRVAKNSETSDVVLWEKKEVPPSILKLLENHHAKITLYKTSPLIFRFLDGLSPGQAKALLPVLHELLHQEAAELVYAMLVKRIRILIMIAGNEIPAGLAPWQITRLTTQSRAFTMDELEKAHRKLTEFEYAWKSGRTPFSVSEFLATFVISLQR